MKYKLWLFSLSFLATTILCAQDNGSVYYVKPFQADGCEVNEAREYCEDDEDCEDEDYDDDCDYCWDEEADVSEEWISEHDDNAWPGKRDDEAWLTEY